MYELLYRFLVRNKRIDLPGIGAIVLQIRPAESQFVNQSFLPPRYYAALEKEKQTTPAKLFSWLAASYNSTEADAADKFNDFILQWRTQLDAGRKVVWSRVGTFQKQDGGEIKFETNSEGIPWLEQTLAKKVIRENAEHSMLVGETEKTSVQMTELLSNPRPVTVKRYPWWVWPLALIIAISIFLGWYFSTHGMSGTATGNHHRAAPAEAPSGYK